MERRCYTVPVERRCYTVQHESHTRAALYSVISACVCVVDRHFTDPHVRLLPLELTTAAAAYFTALSSCMCVCVCVGGGGSTKNVELAKELTSLARIARLEITQLSYQRDRHLSSSPCLLSPHSPTSHAATPLQRVH